MLHPVILDNLSQPDTLIRCWYRRRICTIWINLVPFASRACIPCSNLKCWVAQVFPRNKDGDLIILGTSQSGSEAQHGAVPKHCEATGRLRKCNGRKLSSAASNFKSCLTAPDGEGPWRPMRHVEKSFESRVKDSGLGYNADLFGPPNGCKIQTWLQCDLKPHPSSSFIMPECLVSCLFSMVN